MRKQEARASTDNQRQSTLDESAKISAEKINDNQRERRYIYCIIKDGQERKFPLSAIGGGQDEIYSIFYQDIAVVISPSPIIRYSISRENTVAHQKVLEELMNDFTILPVKFGTVASNKDGFSVEERIKEKVLKARYKELKDLLLKMDNKIELGLKAFWIDMKVIFQEIVDENSQIKKLKQKLVSKPFVQPFGEKATLGEMVKNALERKKVREEKDILSVLKGAYVDWSKNKVFGDRMITNSSFLVEKSKVEEFDKLVDRLAATYEGRIKFKYVGPIPPINFAVLVINLEH